MMIDDPSQKSVGISTGLRSTPDSVSVVVTPCIEKRAQVIQGKSVFQHHHLSVELMLLSRGIHQTANRAYRLASPSDDSPGIIWMELDQETMRAPLQLSRDGEFVRMLH